MGNHMSAPGASGDTRTRILTSAAHLFATKGYGETTTREITEAVGVQKATLYHHYDSKAAILYDICVAALSEIQSSVERAQAEQGTEGSGPTSVLDNMIRAHLETALGDREMHATMLVEMRRLNESQLTDVLAARRQYETLFFEQIAAGQHQGLMRQDLDPRLLMLGLLNLLNWTIFWYSDEGPTTPSELARMFTSMYLEGAGPNGQG